MTVASGWGRVGISISTQPLGSKTLAHNTKNLGNSRKRVFTWTAFMASSTVLKTGKSRCMVPPLPALTPPTFQR